MLGGNRQPNEPSPSTRSKDEVQDSNAEQFSKKLQAVFRECHRVLKDDGLLVFTYHHSRNDGWKALADAMLGRWVCRGQFASREGRNVRRHAEITGQRTNPTRYHHRLQERRSNECRHVKLPDAMASAREKLRRLQAAGFDLSRNDRKIVFYGQLLTTLTSAADADAIADHVEQELAQIQAPVLASRRSLPLFPND